MSNLTTQKIIEHFNSTLERDVPFPLSEIFKAVEKSAMEGDEKSLERLLYSMTDAYVRLNPNKPRETIIKDARDTFATLAYLADHNPSPEEWKSIGPIDTYAHECDYGRAMSLVKKIFENQKIDIMKDVFCYNK